MLKNLRRKLADWLLEDHLREVNDIILQYNGLLKYVSLDGKEIHLEGLAGILGSLNNCTITIEPKIEPRIILSEFNLEAALKLLGKQQLVSGSFFTTIQKAVELSLNNRSLRDMGKEGQP